MKAPHALPFGEFVALMATMTALIALSIDMMLPALPAIAATLGVRRANDTQLIVSLVFLGFGFGQFFYGPISESVGRKPAVYVGLALFSTGCLLALVARSFPVMLVGRVLQGIGVGGPRAMTIALVRDRFEGRAMARVMSLVMAVFILVPVIAPSIGQVILRFAGWRTIFGVYLTLSLVLWVWFAWRQEETLATVPRLPFSVGNLVRGAREVFGNRHAVGYTAAAGLVYGAFIGYLSSVQQILQEQYALGPRFPLYFSTLAIALGGASLCNARIVGRYGMRPLAGGALKFVFVLSVVFLAVVASRAGHPPLWALIAFLLASFFGIGLLFGNLNALAMQAWPHRRHRRGGRWRVADADLAGLWYGDRAELRQHRAAARRGVCRSQRAGHGGDPIRRSAWIQQSNGRSNQSQRRRGIAHWMQCELRDGRTHD